MKKDARVVGIDLGTTHTALAWADPASGEGAAIFPIAELVAAGTIAARPLFPSCLYAPLEGESPADPWSDAPWVIGEFARRRGGEVPGRLVASAKSWLCHAGVNREAPILPWGAGEDAADLPRVSPVEASARILGHLRRAWDAEHPEHPLAEQDVVLTVPASFDEVARELTVLAARRAGLSVRLLEEPQAAFYDWMDRAGPQGLGALLGDHAGDALVLVCDVGGGTTDSSLIRVTRGDAGEPAIERVAVGSHLLLGGDNMDLALAHLVEPRLVQEGERLDPARFGQLVLACRAAKERLLSEGAPDDVAVTLLGRGSALLGGMLTARLTRAEVERVVLEGFFPETPRDARPKRGRGGLVAFGLPYEQDAAITRHVAWFFARHAPSAAAPDALLLNGGVFRASAIAERLASAIGAWASDVGGSAKSAAILPHADPDLAVARGAVAYGLALRGRGVRIGGGAARGYYVGLEAPKSGPRSAICVVPRGAEEGVRHVARDRVLALTVGRPVRFDVFASDAPVVDAPGDVVPMLDDRFQPLPPLATSLKDDASRAAGGSRASEVRVVLEGELTAVGTLELACVEVGAAESPRRFRLAFQLREPAEAEALSHASRPPPSSLGGRRLDEARAAILAAFGKQKAEAGAREAKNLLRELERILGDRASWTTETARALGDELLPSARARRRSPDHERAFWMLAGYCLRPGFGHPLDEGRIRVVAPLFAEGLAFPAEARGYQQFWIAWRRLAGGLDEASQTQIRDATDPLLAPPEAKRKKPKGMRLEAASDLLEMVSSLERVAPARKSELGGWILERTWTESDPRLWAAIGRIGARLPAYASVHHVVPPRIAERWIDHLLREKWQDLPTAAPAGFALARRTGDRARDVSDSVRRDVERRLTQVGAKDEWIHAVREVVAQAEAERVAFFGEGLPVGLRLVD